MKNLKYIVFGILFLFVFFQCSEHTTTSTNYAHLYSGKSANIIPEYVVYHTNKNETELHFRIKSDDILYARKDKTQPYQAKISVNYKLYNIESKKVIVDSATITITDETPQKQSNFLNGKVKIKATFGNNYILKVLAIDQNRNSSNEQELSLNKTMVNSRQFFLVKDAASNEIIYQNYLNKTKQVTIYSQENAGKQGRLDRYHRDFPIAAPPFSSVSHKPFDYKADKSEFFIFDNEGKFSCEFRDSGFVHLVLDTTSKLGLTFFGFDKNFPKIKNVFGMVDPVRFISSNSEFEKLNDINSLKKRMDEFWISKCGSEERGREIIQKYYSRVEYANDLFTSYIEGWKTDRGMVSIIFGSPKTVRRVRDEEIWFYGEENNALALQFTFVSVDNPFTENDYKLLRSPGYKTNWYRAVDAWRSGRVYWAQ